VWLSIVSLTLPASAQPIRSVEQIPALDRGAADFYAAIVGAGPRVQIEWKLAPASVERNGHTELTLAVSSAANPDELQRPPLADMPEFRTLFDSIENLPDRKQGKVVEFRYRLRPRNEGEFELPLPKYRYYVPQLPEGRRFQLATAPGLKLTVTRPVEAKAQAVPIIAPEEFFRLPAERNVEAFSYIPPFWWFAAFTLPMVLAALGIFAYRWIFPDAARRAKLVRRREVRAAIQRLDNAADAGDVERAINGYLQARWGIHADRLTALERVEAFDRLQSQSFSTDELRRLFAECEQSRFGDGNANPAGEARAWVLAVEAYNP
jgi:hypothetical protein